jgi:hypothetical protein
MNQPRYKYIVMLHPEDVPYTGFKITPTILHKNTGDAEVEARRLARQHPDKRFLVGVIYKHVISYTKTAECHYEPHGI